MLKRIYSFARAALGRDRFERNMADEIRFHVDSRTADLIRGGLPESRRGARGLEFGSIEKHKEESRQLRPQASRRSAGRCRTPCARSEKPDLPTATAIVDACARHWRQHRDVQSVRRPDLR
jgi:hypothetical protein